MSIVVRYVQIVNLSFHPSAKDVLMAADMGQVHLLNVEKGVTISDNGTVFTHSISHGRSFSAPLIVGLHPDTIYSACFSYTGGLIATACKDKALRLFDVRC